MLTLYNPTLPFLIYRHFFNASAYFFVRLSDGDSFSVFPYLSMFTLFLHVCHSLTYYLILWSKLLHFCCEKPEKSLILVPCKLPSVMLSGFLCVKRKGSKEEDVWVLTKGSVWGRSRSVQRMGGIPGDASRRLPHKQSFQIRHLHITGKSVAQCGQAPRVSR